MIKTILLSLLITTIVSCAAGFIGSLMFGIEFIKVCVIMFLLQLAGSYIWNSLLQYIARIKMETEETKRIELYTQQGVTANCAYCKTPNYVPIRMDESNNFKCENCDKENSIYVDIVVAQKTDIIDKDNLSISEYIKDKVDAEERIRG
ncbi:MAG: hypothetical protein EBY39_07905 [Flavobacteriia bacterium]|nr:hypothetical protein [Flavobacteriia bacterium]